MSEQDVADVLCRLLDNLRKDDYAGYDAFDGLNSRLLRISRLDRYSWVRLFWIQFFKRSPINLRTLVGVPKMRNPKGIGLVILGLLHDYSRTGERHFIEESTQLADWLLENRCDRAAWRRSCWGYHFPWQARAFYVAAGTPNIITTCYVARALFDLHSHTRERRFFDVACDAGCFIAETLYTEHEGRRFFAYVPRETAFVHNASLWGAAVVAKTARNLNDPQLSELAYTVCMQSASEQMSDGAWAYGGRLHHRFIDGFHTGYNLEALHIARQELSTRDFDQAIDKGVAYYRDRFFLDDGTAKYYDHSPYPIDMHSIAQAIVTLLKVGGLEDDRRMVDRVVEWALKHMYIESTGYFRYQITRWVRNDICYMRWTQAWAYYSLALYLNFKK